MIYAFETSFQIRILKSDKTYDKEVRLIIINFVLDGSLAQDSKSLKDFVVQWKLEHSAATSFNLTSVLVLVSTFFLALAFSF